MNYTKPEVAVLGQAAEVIAAFSSKPPCTMVESPPNWRANPAYDLDE